MPKLKYRYRVVFENLGVSTPRTELTKQVMTFTRPTINFEEIEIPVYNSRVYLAGKPEWETVTCMLRDDASGFVQKLVGQQVQKQFDFVEQASARSGIDYKFTTKIEVLDGGNGANGANVIDRFQLVGCYLESANYNSLDYGSNDPVTIETSIRYDNAVQTPLGTGIGATVGRTLGDVVTG